MVIKNIGHKVLYFSLTKILIGIIVVGGIVVMGQAGVERLLSYTSIGTDIKNLIIGIIIATLAIFSYTFLFKFYEKRNISELSLKGISKNLIAGIILGVILQSLTVLVIYLYGGYLLFLLIL